MTGWPGHGETEPLVLPGPGAGGPAQESLQQGGCDTELRGPLSRLDKWGCRLKNKANKWKRTLRSVAFCLRVPCLKRQLAQTVALVWEPCRCGIGALVLSVQMRQGLT